MEKSYEEMRQVFDEIDTIKENYNMATTTKGEALWQMVNVLTTQLEKDGAFINPSNS